MISIDLGNNFRAIPRDAATLNGLELPQLNTFVEPYRGYWVVMAPNGRAIDGENNRPYVYQDINEAQQDVLTFVKYGHYSTCR